MALGEADTCRLYVVPRLQDAGWEAAPHCFNEQKTFTDGRIVVSGDKVRRQYPDGQACRAVTPAANHGRE